MAYCTTCGSPVEAGVPFCTHCGTVVQRTGVTAKPAEKDTAKPAESTPLQNASVVAPLQPAAATKGGCGPTVFLVLAVLAVVAAVGIGEVLYAGYKMKQKATVLLHNTAPDASTPAGQPNARPSESKPDAPDTMPSGNAAGILDSLTKMLGDEGDPVDSINDQTPVDPCPAASLPSQSAAKIPMQLDTVITTAWGIKYGDVESRNSITSTTPTSFIQEERTEAYRDDNGHLYPTSSYTDTVCYDDLANANTYVTVTTLHMPHLIHGVTRLRLSSKSFDDASTTGKTTFRYFDILMHGDDIKPTYEEGLLARVEPGDVPYPMIVNDQRVNLPAIHLAGFMKSAGKDPTPKKDRPVHTEAEFYVLDEPLNPLVLMMRMKDPVLHDGKFRIEVVKIDYKTAHPVNNVEKQLSEQKRAITYGIYFDFNKDTIKPESETVLKQIVQAMTDNPGWKLTVNGYTDTIGGDAYNLDLSKRRAAAVKLALVTHYHIAADRLSTNGYGASGPIDTNDTLEGRARNRRVELTRE
jgi:outer membrane protein OmpA-like peptidoglycan-associated protein